MRRLALRLSVMAAILTLGWIAIGYAQQRGDNGVDDESQEPAGSSLSVRSDPRQPNGSTPVARVNPYREARTDSNVLRASVNEPAQGGAWASSSPLFPASETAVAPAPAPASRESAATAPGDPFGPESPGNAASASAGQGGVIPPGPTLAPEPANRHYTQPASGPSLQPNNQSNDQYRNYSEPAPNAGRYEQNAAPAPQPVPPNPRAMETYRPNTPAPAPQSEATLPAFDAPPAKANVGAAEDSSFPNASEAGLSAPERFQREPSSSPLSSYPAESASPLGPPPSQDQFNNPAPAVVAAPAHGFSNEGTGRPANDARLDGTQTPQLSIQKIAPREVQVGKPAVFRVEVKNTGKATAQNVEIRDQIPKGTRLVDTKPAASRGARGELVWKLGKIEPNGGASVEMEVVPIAEGELGSVATVHFSASASTRTRATKPELVLNVSAPKRVLIDGSMMLNITISNSGTGAANDVVLEERVPTCLQHPAGAELEYEVGRLGPGETKNLQLKLAAVRPGQAQNVLIARADAVKEVKKALPIEVVAPQLQLKLAGPRNRYLERKATYELAVSNPGTAPARDVVISAALPSGLKFVKANHNGHYDPRTRTVQWALAELPTGETGTVELTTLPVEMGQHKVQLCGTAERALTVKEEEKIMIDGIAAIRFEVVDVKDPIEVGAETTYEIRVLNQGSKEATRVSLAAKLPAGLEVTAAEGPDNLRYQRGNGALVFEPLRGLSPKQDVTYRIRVRGRQAGDQRIRVQLTAAELQSPVTKEESTRVFSDQ